MTEQHELRRALRALDAGDEPMPSYADDLWDELATAYRKLETTNQVATDVTQSDTGSYSAVVVELSRERESRRGIWDSNALRLASAAVVAIVLFALVVALRDQPNRQGDVATVPGPDVTATTGPLVLLEPDQACARYRASEPTVSMIATAFAGEPGSVDAAGVRSARDAVEVLRSDLAATTTTELTTLQNLETTAALLGQAALELDRGLVDQAGRTLADADRILRLGFGSDGASDAEFCIVGE